MRLADSELTSLTLPLDLIGGAWRLSDRWAPTARDSSGGRFRDRELPAAALPDLARLVAALPPHSDPRREYAVGHDGQRYRITLFENIDGHALYLRRSRQPALRLDQIGVLPVWQTWLTGLAQPSPDGAASTGLVLVLGDMGSGKTTLAGAMLMSWVGMSGLAAQTLEAPVENVLDLSAGHEARSSWGTFGGAVALADDARRKATGEARILQCDLSDEDEFPGQIQRVMRSGVRHVLIGEYRTPATANATLTCGANGPLVLATGHGLDLTAGLSKVARLAGEHRGHAALDLLAISLRAAVMTRLAPQGAGESLAIEIVEAIECSATPDCPIRSTIRSGRLELLPAMVQKWTSSLRNGTKLMVR
ncbi:MAG: hypothetical protein ACT6RU_14490 [Aliihoeflea sp.]|uniref:hypothetical protein n=1 Tax=Aliihoeflea sp. TaxID=2608088 RepID=UPI004033386D